jgi:hypothetical protein
MFEAIALSGTQGGYSWVSRKGIPQKYSAVHG